MKPSTKLALAAVALLAALSGSNVVLDIASAINRIAFIIQATEE